MTKFSLRLRVSLIDLGDDALGARLALFVEFCLAVRPVPHLDLCKQRARQDQKQDGPCEVDRVPRTASTLVLDELGREGE